MMRRLSLTSFVVLALAASGCAMAFDERPSVDVMAVRLVGLGLTEQQLAVTLCVTNPNINAIAFRRVTADIDVSGAPLAAGVSDIAVTLPPQASTVVPFTVVTTVQNLGPQLLGILRTGGVDYRVNGSVTFQTLGITLPYSRSGRLDPLTGGLELASSATDRSPSRCIFPTREAFIQPSRLAVAQTSVSTSMVTFMSDTNAWRAGRQVAQAVMDSGAAGVSTRAPGAVT